MYQKKHNFEICPLKLIADAHVGNLCGYSRDIIPSCSSRSCEECILGRTWRIKVLAHMRNDKLLS